MLVPGWTDWLAEISADLQEVVAHQRRVREDVLYKSTVTILDLTQGNHSPDNVKSLVFPWRFPALLRGTWHVKCYSYHARTSTKYLYGHKYAVYNKQFRQLFPDKIFSLTFPWLSVKSLTAVKFPDISRFSRQAVTLLTAYCHIAAWRGARAAYCVGAGSTYLLNMWLSTRIFVKALKSSGINITGRLTWFNSDICNNNNSLQNGKELQSKHKYHF